ncbi:MAG TPA: SIS domain-containing protein [Dongiaceae bacterium]|jgi:glucosamine--fructose-6-phosphate aminotransferase (isomerizing)|nr:SIS domain-containing protein [Dongiaceae bacterium]
MGLTEQTIFEQFSYWRAAIGPAAAPKDAEIMVFVGCGTSYNLALSLAAIANASGRPAIAVPGGEWLNGPQSFWPRWQKAHVVALSRSGETTETVAAVKASRAAGAYVTGVTMEKDSALARNCDHALIAETHPAEGIVMTSSASLMLLLGIQLLGHKVPADLVDLAHRLAKRFDEKLAGLIAGRTHFVFLGATHLYGVALEGALKLMEMSQIFTQAFHPLEYRHGPVSLVDERTAVVMLHSADRREAEAKLVGELQEKGARVISFNGPGDASFAVECDSVLVGLACLPALQLLGERAAQARNIDTVSPRHLTKVVTLA